MRTVAVQIIFQVLEQGKLICFDIAWSPIFLWKRKILSLLQEICFGVCRVLPRLEQIVAQLVDKPLRGKKRIVHCLLLVGLYQILYTRIPAYAAVDEVVSTAKSLQLQSFQGLVNAVLRRFLRTR